MAARPADGAELRAASERLHRFADVSSVEGFLEQLSTRAEDAGGPLVRLLPRAPGSREPRWAHLLSPLPVVSWAEQSGEHEAAPSSADWRAEVAALRAELEALRERVQQLESRVPSA